VAMVLVEPTACRQRWPRPPMCILAMSTLLGLLFFNLLEVVVFRLLFPFPFPG
jgi:hypothetical protein